MIPYGRQSVDDDDIRAVIQVLKSDWLTTGPAVEKFESDLEGFTGGTPVVAVSSGTAALHCAYFAAGIGPGDEVITPPITFIATQATAAFCGAKIIFSDIQLETGNIDPMQIEEKITSRTKAIVAVDYAGQPADLDEIRKICDKHKLVFIEDASHALGSKYKDKFVGSIADITTYSFFPTKNITTGEGGAVACKDSSILQRARKFSRQGLIREKEDFLISSEGPWHQEVHDFGLNYRLSDILAALGSNQIKRINKFKLKRKEIFNLYNSLLKSHLDIKTLLAKKYADPFWHLFPVFVPPNKRLEVYNQLRKNNIMVQVNYFPTNRQPVFKNLNLNECPNALTFYKQQISLPIYYNLDESQINFVVKILIESLD